MGKERLSAFMDAILAIIMTILVLELEKPTAPTLAALWDLRLSFFAYGVSFFWLGAMWINLHAGWQKVERISNGVVWWTIIMLFCSSLIPYVTNFVSNYFMNAFAQVFYGVVVLGVSFSNMALNRSVAKANAEDKELYSQFMGIEKMFWFDIGIKVVGMVISLTLFPPATIPAILLAGILPLVTFRKLHERNGT